MDTTKNTTLKLTPEQLEKMVEFVRRSGRPQTLEALTKRYIELLKEKEGLSSR
jgi:Holliday junction resolvase